MAQLRDDCWQIVVIIKTATKAAPKMWGTAIVGFGTRRLTYADGSQRDWMRIAFSPRKQNITLHIMPESKSREKLLAKLGKCSCSGSCLHIRRLSDIHLPTLKKLVKASVQRSS